MLFLVAINVHAYIPSSVKSKFIALFKLQALSSFEITAVIYFLNFIDKCLIECITPLSTVRSLVAKHKKVLNQKLPFDRYRRRKRHRT